MTNGSQSEREKALAWEQGCSADGLRNFHIIPCISEVIEANASQNILDVGAATGHLARTLDEMLSHKPRWTLVDIASDRLALAEELVPGGMQVSHILGDILGLQFEHEFDTAILSFTLLEVPDAGECLRAVSQWLAMDGLLVVVLPDAWEDILRVDINATTLGNFLSGRVELEKIDKFTNQPYPFFAMRIELAIELALRAGFELFRLKRCSYEGSSAYVLAFRFRGARDD